MSELDCRIFFRILFTKYWVGQKVNGVCTVCNHRCFEPISLFTKEFHNGYEWIEVKGGQVK